MTITEYKQRFAALYEQLSEEHGLPERVEITHDTRFQSENDINFLTQVTITF